ncbi:YfhO family protein [Streptomyces sp. NPDC004111]|uniref:YfhO family protein n=1 Tax=Streptomyces sp. NPDC004111 TaxID=3364690 RepID=UPI0036A6287D
MRPTLPAFSPQKHPVAAASLLAAFVAALAHCLGSALAGSQPFGAMNRNVNDLGTQFVPFHARLWDVLHGRADGGWLINWQSGYGSSFLPDVGTYLSSPFAPLVALFPRAQIDLAVYVTSVARIATAAAVMAWLLMLLRPRTAAGGNGRWWLAGVLGAAYALCGWSVIEASYNPMWLDGLIAFPLLCVVGEWVRTGRRLRVWFGSGVLLVALVWAANFYTAYMATLGAGLVLGARLLIDGGPRLPRLRTAARACAVVALGIGVSAPVLLTVFAGTRHAYPGMGLTFRPAGWGDVLARLLPGTYGFNSPAMYVSSAVLVLAFALPFHRRVPVRVRVGWGVLAVAVLVSMQWGPTHLAWHAFAEPNGSPYRQTFVLSGVLVIAGWLSVCHGVPGRRALAAAAGCLVLVVLVAVGSPFGGRWAWLGTAAGLALVAGALALLGRAGRGTDGAGPVRAAASGRRVYAAGAAVLLVGCVVGQSALTTAWAAKRRVATQDDHAPYGPRQSAQSRVIAGVDDWPRHRTEPGRTQTVHNDAMVVGGQGASYYSSMTSDVLTRTLSALGDGWNGSGRAPHSLDNPVTDALFGVGARLRSTYRQGADTDFTVVRRDAPPLVTVRATGGPAPRFGHSAFANQELLLGSRVYERLNGTAGVCTAGAPVFVWAPGFKGVARSAGGDPAGVRFEAKKGRVRAPMQQVGTAAGDGRVRIDLRGTGARGAEVACLREDRLAAAVRGLRASGAESVEAGDGTVRAVLPAHAAGGAPATDGTGATGGTPATGGTGGTGGTSGVPGTGSTPGIGGTGGVPGTSSAPGTGAPASVAGGSAGRTAVVAVPRIAGWQCAVNGGELRPAGSYLGLLAVPLPDGAGAGAADGTTTGPIEVGCEFRPPGLRAGTAVGAGSAGVVAVVGLLGLLRGRRRDQTATPSSTTIPAPLPASPAESPAWR